jgi:hypothetical protein
MLKTLRSWNPTIAFTIATALAGIPIAIVGTALYGKDSPLAIVGSVLLVLAFVGCVSGASAATSRR